MCTPETTKLLSRRNRYALFEVLHRNPDTMRVESVGFRVDGPEGFESEYVADPHEAARRFLELAPLGRGLS